MSMIKKEGHGLRIENTVLVLLILSAVALSIQSAISKLRLAGNYALFLEAGVITLALYILYSITRFLIREHRKPGIFSMLIIISSLGIVIRDIVWLFMYFSVINALK